LIIAGENDIDGRAGQGAAQEVGGIFFDLDHIPEIVGVVKRTVSFLSTIAVLSDTIN
jgi:hypothetical protein